MNVECGIRSLALGVVISILTGCQTVQTTQSGAVGVERKQAMMLSAAQVDAGAAEAYQKTLQQAETKGALNKNPDQVRRVRAIADRLIPATHTFRADAPRWDWDVNVIGSPDINAWCMPGGKIAVYTGLLEKLKINDDELAAVMGHEIAHALREHGRERASQQAMQELGVSVLSAALGLGNAGSNIAGLVADVTIGLPYSRQFETESDRIGVELAARAGYDPRAAISLWEKMAVAGGGQPPQFLSTHPSADTRIADLKVYAERVMPLYRAAQPR